MTPDLLLKRYRQRTSAHTTQLVHLGRLATVLKALPAGVASPFARSQGLSRHRLSDLAAAVEQLFSCGGGRCVTLLDREVVTCRSTWLLTSIEVD